MRPNFSFMQSPTLVSVTTLTLLTLMQAAEADASSVNAADAMNSGGALLYQVRGGARDEGGRGTGGVMGYVVYRGQ